MLEDEESDYEDSAANNKQKTSKYKKSITVNPTEGFRYSDIYLVSNPCDLASIISSSFSFLLFLLSLIIWTYSFPFSPLLQDAPPEEANVVERILSRRLRPTKDNQELVKYGEYVEEFLVKYKN